MYRLIFTLLLLSFNLFSNNKLVVYMSTTCGCCTYWVKHMEENGFSVETVKLNNVDSIKMINKISPQISSCHTGIIDGYFVEGHVPAKDVKKMLSLRPKIRGLAVPGMPAGSNVPGMETKNTPAKYDVLSIEFNGINKIWSQYK